MVSATNSEFWEGWENHGDHWWHTDVGEEWVAGSGRNQSATKNRDSSGHMGSIATGIWVAMAQNSTRVPGKSSFGDPKLLNGRGQKSQICKTFSAKLFHAANLLLSDLPNMYEYVFRNMCSLFEWNSILKQLLTWAQAGAAPVPDRTPRMMTLAHKAH